MPASHPGPWTEDDQALLRELDRSAKSVVTGKLDEHLQLVDATMES